ncbi:unnamed protein product [Debaryomyces tyrocola]|nr:unnamed protein product [Debaryomyces tyrocola]
MAVPQGNEDDGTPLKNLVPLIPFGPSEVLIEGIPNLFTGTVCQKSTPAKREIFSDNVNS